MIDKNKDLTKKMVVESSSDEEDDVVLQDTEVDPITPSQLLKPEAIQNPWLFVPGMKHQQPQQQAPEPKLSEYSRPKALQVQQPETKSPATKPVKNKSQSPGNNDTNAEDTGSKLQQVGKAGAKSPAKSKGAKKAKKKAQQSHNQGTEDVESTAEVVDNLFDTLDKFEQAKAKVILEKRQSKQKKNQKTAEKTVRFTGADDLEEDTQENSGSLISVSLTRKRTLEDLEGDWSEESETEDLQAEPANTEPKTQSNKKTEVSRHKVQVDPKNFMTVERRIMSSVTADVIDDEEEEAAEEERRMTISEAFASDDVVEEFNLDKREAEDQQKVKDIDLTLPGWGNWGGAGVKPKQKKG